VPHIARGITNLLPDDELLSRHDLGGQMAISLAVLLAFVAGFVVRPFLDQDNDHDVSTEVEQHYGESRFHSYD